MLKWTTLARREAESVNERHLASYPDNNLPRKSVTPQKAKRRRRSSTQRRRSSRESLDALDADKENQFTSTPIKSADHHHGLDPLRDVSNLGASSTGKKCKSDKKRRHSSPKMQQKKKKSCVNPSHNQSKDASNYFQPFETVDSHIEGILVDDRVCLCSSKKTTATSKTLPTFGLDYSPCSMLNTCVNPTETSRSNFFPDISRITVKDSPPKAAKTKSKLLKKSTPKSAQKLLKRLSDNHDQIKVTPLVKKFLDLRFSKIFDENQKEDNSSFINELSLDEIVDALLESSSSNKEIAENIDNENINNETNEDEIKQKELHVDKKETNFEEKSFDGSSADSGFRSNSTNCHQMEGHFTCKCNNNGGNNFCDKTIINLSEPFNERSVDVEIVPVNNINNRKRNLENPTNDNVTSPKRRLLETNLDFDQNFTLKRQKCIRRRKSLIDPTRKLIKVNGIKTPLPNIEDDSCDFEGTPLGSCYMENKEILQDNGHFQRIRKCINFESPKESFLSENTSSNSISSSKNVDVKGSIDVKLKIVENTLIVEVIKCNDLYRPSGKNINAYVKVAIVNGKTSSSTSDHTNSSKKKRSNSNLQRTAVQGDSNRPLFNHTFKFLLQPLPLHQDQRVLVIEIWHRERINKTSEFLGCVTFAVKDVYSKNISGSYRLLPQSTGRPQFSPPITQSSFCFQNNKPLTDSSVKMDANQPSSSSNPEEMIYFDDALDNDLKKTTNKQVLSEQQKYADENLFLRYLELDPTEGPDAIPAATQRKATGNRNGRTPFTQTKKLVRPPKSGFGFSVVWTHPPRIERVEKGLPADKAGILPGDYIIFVDKHNVVMMPEIDILNLIRSYGNQLTLEIFRRNSTRNGSLPSVRRVPSSSGQSTGSQVAIAAPILTSQQPQQQQQQPPQQTVSQLRRPSTVCSTTNTTSIEYNRRKLNLPQVTFSAEKQTNNPEENRKKAIYQLITKEQQYVTAMQFAVARFVSALAERRDLLTPHEHRVLFQNAEEILRISENILDHLVVPDDGEPQVQHLPRIYHMKLHEITTAYKRYCSGIKRADALLVSKTKNSNSDFVRFLQVPAVPRRRPDITAFIHKPLEHYRDLLRFLTSIQTNTKPNHEDYAVINQIVHEIQLTYREITSDSGLMEPVGEGRPLLTVQDVENRLVFTKCKPFVLNKPGRQWIFGGDLSRVEGRNIRQYWTLLFSDLLLFAKVSRDRVLFIMEDPIPLAHVYDMSFNVRKKDTEFRITISPEGKHAKSPTVHCGLDLSRTPKKGANKRTVILRAPTTELKAVWQNLLQRQIFQVNSGMTEGSSFSSPLESPDAPITSSVATLQSAESFTSRRQTPQNLNQNEAYNNRFDAMIEQKCKQLSKTNFNSKCNAIHLEKWIKNQLQSNDQLLEGDEAPLEDWTEEMLRKRSEELKLIDSQGNIKYPQPVSKRNEKVVEEASDHEESPSKSTTTESQVTVKSSPLVPEMVRVCKQCHKNCLNSSSNGNISFKDCIEDGGQNDGFNDDWQPLILLGLHATNPTTSLVKLDPFTVPPVPQISVLPATPENSIKNNKGREENCNECQKPSELNLTQAEDISPDDSPQTEEHPYHSLNSSVATLRRFGTLSSLERVGSEDLDDQNNSSDDEYGEGGIDNEAFQHSTIRNWTAKAGNFVAEKMSFFAEEYSGGFFDRYLRTTEGNVMNGEDLQEEETSGATSGEEIWGTPTSGGDLDDPLSPNYEGKQSPNDGSISSDNNEDTELMMDELLMTPPISGAIMRGLLPRRTLEPLIEECSETSSSSSTQSLTEPSLSPEQQGNEIGSAADTCLTAVERSANLTPPRTEDETADLLQNTTSEAAAETMRMPRSESYRRIIEAAEEQSLSSVGIGVGAGSDICFFSRFKPAAKFVNIERIPRSKSIKIFEFFNMRRLERRIYESYPDQRPLVMRTLSQEDCLNQPMTSENKVQSDTSLKCLKDKQMDRRFWKQLSKRRSKPNSQA